MTHLTRAAAFLLLLAALGALAACDAGSRPEPAATTSTAAPATVKVPGEGAPAEEHILYAAALLRAYHVEQPRQAPLLMSAWEGALRAARRHFEPPRDIAPAEPVEGVFAGSLRALLALAPPGIEDEIVSGAISEMATSLADDHTYFLKRRAYQLYQANAVVTLGYSGVRGGNGYLAWYVQEGGPAARAGILAGDVILSIDGRPAASDDDAADRDGLEAGVPLRLVVERPGGAVFETEATPELSARPVLEWRMLGEAAYIRLHRFPPPQALMPDGLVLGTHLDRLLTSLGQSGVRSFVLDLRNNPGGSELVAANVAGRFGLTGTLVENRRREGEGAALRALGGSGIGTMPLALLINQNSASSSELVASALQQAGRARLFGERSAGIVNTSRTWAVGGGGLFITTERAYAGERRLYLDRAGVTPDEVVTLDRLELARGRDTQLERALEWLRSQAGAVAGTR